MTFSFSAIRVAVAATVLAAVSMPSFGADATSRESLPEAAEGIGRDLGAPTILLNAAGGVDAGSVVTAAAISLVNAGLEGFVRAAALELPRSIRINIVSPPWVTETLQAMKMDPSPGTPAAVVARAYVRSLEGSGTGLTLDARE